MSFEIKSNPNQFADNLVMIPKVGSGDPLNQNKEIRAKFRTSFLNTDIATLTKIFIDGVQYDFASTRATDTAAGRAGIATEIQNIMTTLLGVNDGRVVVGVSGTRVYIVTSFSSLKIEKVGVASTYSAFIPVDAQIVGTIPANVATPVVHVALHADGLNYKVRVKPVCGKSISAFSINWAGSPWTTG